jgi:hypothetical protein
MDNLKTHNNNIFSSWKKRPSFVFNNTIIIATNSNNGLLTAADVVTMIVRSLEKSVQEDLSFELKPSGKSIVLRARNQLIGCIHFYSENGTGIIQFQKLWGDVVQFHHFYIEVKSILMNDHPDIFSVDFNKVAPPLVNNSLPFSFLPEKVVNKVKLFEKNNLKTLYNSLIEFCKDKHTDVSTEGISGLTSAIEEFKATIIPVGEIDNFVKILNYLFQTKELSHREYIARILFALSDDIQVKQAVQRLKESGKVDICETLSICLKNIYPITYMNAVLEKRLRLIVSKFRG